jgi:hypothetical protein
MNEDAPSSLSPVIPVMQPAKYYQPELLH